MAVDFQGAPDVVIVNTYCREADTALAEKTKHCAKLTDTMDSFSCEAAVCLGGDFEARLYSRRGLDKDRQSDGQTDR